MADGVLSKLKVLHEIELVLANCFATQEYLESAPSVI